MKTISTLVLSSFLLSATPALAEEGGETTTDTLAGTGDKAESRAHPTEGMSLSFGIPSGGNGYVAGAAGIWLMVIPDLNLGVNVGIALDTAGDVLFDMILGPAVRYYLTSVGPVSPFISGQLNFRIVTQPDTDVELSLSGGFGAEWFVTEQFSIAGNVGLGFDILRVGTDPVGFGTFTSGLTAQLYF